MKSLWSDTEAAAWSGDLAQRVYTSRLLGRDSSLVLHGGGNTSVKITETNLVGEAEALLYIKGSGWDLEHIEAAGFAPVRMQHLLKLAQLETLSDPQMVNELKTQTTLASAPSPSVETILHATLPYKFVDHTHADAVVTITNTDAGEARIREIYGDRVVVIPYVMPGFDLARVCAREFVAQRNHNTIGMVLLNHGIFSFGDDARTSYERMIELVNAAEQYLADQGAWEIGFEPPQANDRPIGLQLAALRRSISNTAGRPMLVSSDRSDAMLAFARRQDLARITQRGPATPDHIIRTKRVPMLGRDTDSYAQAYAEYFQRHAPHVKDPKTMLDPAPRVVLDPMLGLCSVGSNAAGVAIVNDIYRHTVEVLLGAEVLGGFRALSERDLFDVEYWDLEQAKLAQSGSAPEFAGEVALVTGAASGIGKACVASLLARGAAVVGVDIDPAVVPLFDTPAYLGVAGDVTGEMLLAQSLEAGATAFGGLDMLILNAGVFPASRRIEALTSEEWQRTINVNLDANLTLMRLAYPYLKLAHSGGRVVVIGSKNVPAPGPGAAAYSASKAALNQLARVAALEWGGDGIRINSVHPNAVFDTGIWTDEVLRARAEHYGMSVEAYKTNNVLGVEITSEDVAELVASMCGKLFAKTTGAQLPVDGGNERVI